MASAAAAALAGSILAAPIAVGAAPPPVATQLDIVGPAGSEAFGSQVLVLSNGNYVVTDPLHDEGGITDVGAVYLYDGLTNQPISVVTGSTADDRVGERELVEVGDGDVVVHSPDWDFGSIVDAGAVTHIDGTTGLSGTISPTNSLHGTATNDLDGRIVDLPSGAYVGYFEGWDDGATSDVGAVVHFPGDGGVVGPVTTTNSLHGTTANDHVGRQVFPLDNGNYVVVSSRWNNGGVSRAGAATWVDGSTGLTGPVTTTNSLHGTTANDGVGGQVYQVGDSNYVVTSTQWNNGPVADVGAVTWADGTTGITGPVTTSNSLHGATAGDQIGISSVFTLTNGNYVVASQYWDNGPVADVGAATWADGSTGITGPVTTSNSLHGATAGDAIATNGVTPLTNGNYVVTGDAWDNGPIVDAGASVWADGTTGITGPVTTSNSLYGTTAGDRVRRARPLANGNYVVEAPDWDNGAIAGAGAVVWGDGTTGITGPVTTDNSLHGTHDNDFVGSLIYPLVNGNYAVVSPGWDDDTVIDAGAVTWGDGSTGTTGPVTTFNSLHGSTTGDRVGSERIVELTDRNLVVGSSEWSNGATLHVGAATWIDIAAPTVGPVTTSNSLYGTSADDRVSELGGRNGTIPLPRGHYALGSDRWDNAGIVDAGAISVGRSGGAVGPVTAANSAIGTPGATAGMIATPSDRLTAGEAIVVATEQNRVILILSDLVSREPARLLDTRTDDGITTIDGLALGWGPVAAGTSIDIQIAGRGGVPANAETAVLNLAAVRPEARGYATLYPCGGEPPLVSSLNYDPGANISNATLVTLSPTGTICLFSSATAHFAIDVVGYTPGGSKVGTLDPARLLDTRSGPDIATIDDESLGAGRLAADEMIEVQVAGRGSVPADASSAVLNLAAVTPSGRGYATLYPCGPTRPVVSALNYEEGTNISNATIVKLSPTGTVCLYTSTEAHYALDVSGFVPPGSNVATLGPGRLLDTRSGPGITTIDGTEIGAGPIQGSQTITVQVTGRGGVPTGARGVVVNLAAVRPAVRGYATLYPCTSTPPTASSLNYEAGSNVSNATFVRLSDTGSVCIFSSSTAHFALDVLGAVE